MLGLLVLAVAGCEPTESNNTEGNLSVTKLELMSSVSGVPNVFTDKENLAFLTWVEYVDDSTDALKFSKLNNDQWSEPMEISRGTDWFVNWADFPSFAIFPESDNTFAAYWLQKVDKGVYDYDVRISVSKDGGTTWAPSFIPHTDGIAAEHGFATLLPLAENRMLAVWLDGRNTKINADVETTEEHGGAMTLRSAEFDQDGKLYNEYQLDEKVCDCCQTDAVLTECGPVVVYRDRTSDEIRDISIVRYVEGRWTVPSDVSGDSWNIAGCPVNGPAVAARGKNVAVAWFTGANGENKVLVKFSTDCGKTFSNAIRVDDGDPLGRVDIEFTDRATALVSWMEQVGDGGEIRIARVTDKGSENTGISIVKTGVTRQNGFPILAAIEKGFILAYTEVNDSLKVRTIKFMLD